MAKLPKTNWEYQLGYPVRLVAGVDEVGRGCLAGPVVAAALILPPGLDLGRPPGKPEWLREVADSKMLSPEKRAELAPLIREWALGWGVGYATVEEIDRINIYHASHLAMLRALEAMQRPFDHVLVDGNQTPKNLPVPATAVVKGDQLCLSVAAASVIAKVWRDERMRKYDERFPGYGFAVHKGYSTPAHARALKALGPCDLHRRSVAPVREAAQLAASSSFSLE